MNDNPGPQKITIFQQNGSGENKIAGVREYGDEIIKLEIISIDDVLPLLIEDAGEYLPGHISADLVLDFLKHQDLSQDLVALCAKMEIPIISSGKKILNKWVMTPPT